MILCIKKQKKVGIVMFVLVVTVMIAHSQSSVNYLTKGRADSLYMALLTCTDDEILKYDLGTSSWACDTDLTSGGGSGGMWGVEPDGWMRPNASVGASQTIDVDDLNVSDIYIQNKILSLFDTSDDYIQFSATQMRFFKNQVPYISLNEHVGNEYIIFYDDIDDEVLFNFSSHQFDFRGNVSAQYYCNDSNCYTVDMFLNDTTIQNCSVSQSCTEVMYWGDKVGNDTTEIRSVIYGSENISFSSGVISLNLSCEDITGSADLCDGDDASGGGGGGTNQSIFFNTTYDNYNANLSIAGLTGYEAGNHICDSNFTDTHLCSWTEIVRTYDLKDVSTIDAWTATAWISGGPSKYTGVGVLFVNDCHGFTDHTGTDAYGNAWSFNDNKGLTGNCGSEIPLACCKAW